jgi:hypothetical protein
MSEKVTQLHPDLPNRAKVCEINKFSWDWGMYLSNSSARDDKADYVG